MDNDDRQIGRILSRREMLKLMGVTAAGLLAGCVPDLSGNARPTETPAQATEISTGAENLPVCVVRPEVTEGPYYLDDELNRSDIRSEPSDGEVKEGALLSLAFIVSQVASGACTPLEGAKVEIWHCDAEGVYSGVSDPGFNTQDQRFLRGYQVTDANGRAAFTTIYPGWYSGRTVHIHFKIHHDTSSQSSEFTSQLFFDEALSDKVFEQGTYAARGQRNTLNSADGIYRDELLLDVAESDDGYAAVFNIGLQM